MTNATATAYDAASYIAALEGARKLVASFGITGGWKAYATALECGHTPESMRYLRRALKEAEAAGN